MEVCLRGGFRKCRAPTLTAAGRRYEIQYDIYNANGDEGVYVCERRTNVRHVPSRRVCVKTGGMTEGARTEMEILLRAVKDNAQHVVQIIDAIHCPTDDTYLMSTLMCARGTMDLVRWTGFGRELFLRQGVRDVVSALTYVHDELAYVHMDVKPENIFVDACYRFKLGDFDIALPVGKRVDMSLPDARYPGTVSFAAPELDRAARKRLTTPPVDRYMDYYSLGRTVAHVLRGEDDEPRPKRENEDLARFIELATHETPHKRSLNLTDC